MDSLGDQIQNASGNKKSMRQQSSKLLPWGILVTRITYIQG